MKKVLVFGTFDGLHPGHVNFFKQAKKYGQHLTVVIARDSTVKKTKGCLPLRKERKRLLAVKNNSLVDEAFLGSKSNPYRIIKKINPDFIILGYDQKSFVKNLDKELKKIEVDAKIYRAKPYKAKKFHSVILDKRKCLKREKTS